MNPSDATPKLDSWLATARAAGMKVTHQRLEIFRELAGSHAHPDAETVYRAVHARLPTVSLDTVYRTLWRLHELGLVDTLGPRSSSQRFDTNVTHHHHFTCLRCGEVRDFESDALDALVVPEAISRYGGIVDARVEVRGFCTRCRDGEASPPSEADVSHDRRTSP